MAADCRPHRPTCAPWVAVAMTNLALAGSLARQLYTFCSILAISPRPAFTGSAWLAETDMAARHAHLDRLMGED